MHNNTPNPNSSKKRFFVFSIITVFIIIVAIIIIILLKTNHDSTYSAKLRFFVRPSDATVLLDGEPIDISSGLVHVTPGDHSVAIIRAGFFPEGEEFTIKEGETRDFDYALSPFSEEAKNLAEDFEY